MEKFTEKQEVTLRRHTLYLYLRAKNCEVFTMSRYAPWTALLRHTFFLCCHCAEPWFSAGRDVITAPAGGPVADPEAFRFAPAGGPRTSEVCGQDRRCCWPSCPGQPHGQEWSDPKHQCGTVKEPSTEQSLMKLGFSIYIDYLVSFFVSPQSR